jgi:hypothetical protein
MTSSRVRRRPGQSRRRRRNLAWRLPTGPSRSHRRRGLDHLGGDGGVEPRGGAVGRRRAPPGRSMSISTRSRRSASRTRRRWCAARARAYVDMAVMAPVHPRGHKTPVLVAGDQRRRQSAKRSSRLDFDFRVIGDEVGGDVDQDDPLAVRERAGGDHRAGDFGGAASGLL